MQETLGENIFLLIIFCTGGFLLVVISFVLLFIRNQHKLLKNRQQIHDAAMAHQKELMSTVIQSQEKERRRIGQDLHDQVGSSLSNLRMLIHRNQQVITDAAVAYKNLIDKIIEDVRNISHNLSPPALALFGFSEALEEMRDIANHNETFQLSVINHAEQVSEKLPYPTALALIRVLQELIANTLKHAGAQQAGISVFMENEQLVVHYTDNGTGYDLTDVGKQKGMGMQNIESRIHMVHGQYRIITAPAQGFSCFISLPPETILHE